MTTDQKYKQEKNQINKKKNRLTYITNKIHTNKKKDKKKKGKQKRLTAPMKNTNK